MNITIPLDSARELRDLLGRLREQLRHSQAITDSDFMKLIEWDSRMELRVAAAEAEAMFDAQDYVKETVGA